MATNQDTVSAPFEMLLTRHDYFVSGRRGRAGSLAVHEYPLIIAIPGGGCTSRYFDVPHFSLLDRASALGIPIIAVDRPGYAASSPLPDQATILGNAERLTQVIDKLWDAGKGNARGVVLVGHSIGGAIAIAIAASQPAWPLLGLAVSGVGLVSPSRIAEAWAALPQTEVIDLPETVKDQAMFGPSGTYVSEMPQGSRIATAPMPRAELIDIVTTWPAIVKSLAEKVTVPVHYRQGEFDPLWIANHDQVLAFEHAFSTSPSVDARLCTGAGHCIDFHRVGAAFQLEQLAFALRCAVMSRDGMREQQLM